MISKSEKILMSLNNKQSNFTKWQPQNSTPKDTKSKQTARKWQQRLLLMT